MEEKGYPFGKKPRAVRCLDRETDEVIAEYRSIFDAAKALGKMSARAPITFCCQGLQASAYGYRWEYKD